MSDEGSYVGGLNITTNENINMSLTSNENATLQQLTADKCCHKGMEIPVKYTNGSIAMSYCHSVIKVRTSN